MPLAASPSHLCVCVCVCVCVCFQLSQMKSIMASSLTSSSLHNDSAKLYGRVSSNFKLKISLWVLELLLLWSISMHFYTTCPSIHHMHTHYYFRSHSLIEWSWSQNSMLKSYTDDYSLFLRGIADNKSQPVFPPLLGWTSTHIGTMVKPSKSIWIPAKYYKYPMDLLNQGLWVQI
jgi:hypothetical protein